MSSIAVVPQKKGLSTVSKVVIAVLIIFAVIFVIVALALGITAFQRSETEAPPPVEEDPGDIPADTPTDAPPPTAPPAPETVPEPSGEVDGAPVEDAPPPPKKKGGCACHGDGFRKVGRVCFKAPSTFKTECK